MPARNRQIVLAARPNGLPSESDFALAESAIPSPSEGEALVRVIYLSVDPYMRGLLNPSGSYASAVDIGSVMVGGAVGEVLESHAPEIRKGDYVEGMLGWQEYAVGPASALRRVDPTLAPISTALDVLGMPGLTAWFGLLEVGNLQAGDTVLVSGAAGAVGSMACQIARIKGCRVAGSAGSDDKVDYLLHEVGVDAAFNYKTVGNFRRKLREVCPEGIDVYFDNVGGPITDAAVQLLNLRARIVVCGQISQYNLTRPEMEPRWLFHLVVKRARAEGFIVSDYAPRYGEALAEMAEWLRQGRLRCREDIAHGIESAPRAFIRIFLGENRGKQLVKVGEE